MIGVVWKAELDPHILCHMAEIAADAYPPTPYDLGWLRLTHISHSWRAALLSPDMRPIMASLWARVCCTFPSEDAVATLSDRAGQEALIVSHSARLSKDHENVLIHALASRLASVRVLSIPAHSYNWSSLLTSKYLPQLDQLFLEDPIPISSETLYEESFALEEPLVAPKLKSLHLRGGRLLSVDAPSLVTMILTNIRTSTHRILDLVRWCPRLQSLDIDSGTMLSGTRHSEAHVYLPDLKTLRLCLHESVRRELMAGMVYPQDVQVEEADEVGIDGAPLTRALVLPLVMMNHLAPGEEPVELPPYSVLPP
ncbi:unnamed protein product [Peniophora sp. CBMAI 1063]|nr:unnamed protein product [Peniophora sp. CBMAI 1063]